MPVPEVLPIRWMDDLHTAFVGRCANGNQFFINDFWRDPSPSPGSIPDPNNEDYFSRRHAYLVLYIFNKNGDLIDHLFWDGGPGQSCSQDQIDERRRRMLATLGEYRFSDILVRPFSLLINGVTFGLIRDTDPENEAVHLQPGSQISFEEPWDGEFYT